MRDWRWAEVVMLWKNGAAGEGGWRRGWSSTSGSQQVRPFSGERGGCAAEMEVMLLVGVEIGVRVRVLGFLIESAQFQSWQLILVGRRDFNSFGSHGSTSHCRFRHFHSLADARTFLKDKDCDICGVEITDDAVAVNQHPFTKSTAFLLGNECVWMGVHLPTSLIGGRMKESTSGCYTCRLQTEIRTRRNSMAVEAQIRQRKLENQLKLETKLHDVERVHGSVCEVT